LNAPFLFFVVTRPMRPRQFDLIAFDWDGTLFNSTAQIVRAIQAAVRDVGGQVPSDEQAAWVIGMGLMQALAHVAPDVPPERYPCWASATSSIIWRSSTN